MEKSLERQVLVAQIAHNIEEQIREHTREHGDILKSMGVDIKDVGMLGLDIFVEACDVLKKKAEHAIKVQQAAAAK